MQSFNLSIENPADYVGFDGANSRPSSISRSVPEGPVITLASTVKLDANTKGYLANFMNNSAQTALVNHVSNDADQPADLTTAGGATDFGFSCDKAIMMYDIEQKLLFGSFRIRNT
jgi:hypothetical protein